MDSMHRECCSHVSTHEEVGIHQASVAHRLSAGMLPAACGRSVRSVVDTHVLVQVHSMPSTLHAYGTDHAYAIILDGKERA